MNFNILKAFYLGLAVYFGSNFVISAAKPVTTKRSSENEKKQPSPTQKTIISDVSKNIILELSGSGRGSWQNFDAEFSRINDEITKNNKVSLQSVLKTIRNFSPGNHPLVDFLGSDAQNKLTALSFANLIYMLYYSLSFVEKEEMIDKLKKVLNELASYDSSKKIKNKNNAALEVVQAAGNLFYAVSFVETAPFDFSSLVNRTLEWSELLNYRISLIEKFNKKKRYIINQTVKSSDFFIRSSIMLMFERLLIQHSMYGNDIEGLSDENFNDFISSVFLLMLQSYGMPELEKEVDVSTKNIESLNYITRFLWLGADSEEVKEEAELDKVASARNFLKILLSRAKKLKENINGDEGSQNKFFATHFFTQGIEQLKDTLLRLEIVSSEELSFLEFNQEEPSSPNASSTPLKEKATDKKINQPEEINTFLKNVINALADSKTSGWQPLEKHLQQINASINPDEPSDGTIIKLDLIFDIMRDFKPTNNEVKNVTSSNKFESESFFNLLKTVYDNLFFAEENELTKLEETLKAWLSYQDGSNETKTKALNLLKEEGDPLLAISFINPIPPDFSSFISRTSEWSRILLDRISLITKFKEKEKKGTTKNYKDGTATIEEFGLRATLITVLERILMQSTLYNDEIDALEEAELNDFFATELSLMQLVMQKQKSTTEMQTPVPKRNIACMDFLIDLLWQGYDQENNVTEAEANKLVSVKNFFNKLRKIAKSKKNLAENSPAALFLATKNSVVSLEAFLSHLKEKGFQLSLPATKEE